MRSDQPWRFAATTVILACSLAIIGSVLSGCGGDAAGPVQTFTVQGQPIINVASIGVSPGQPADATAYVVNHGSQPVTLVSASAVPVPGYRAGELADAGVATTLAAVGIASGWPPPAPVRGLAGAKLPSGESRIVFGIGGPDTGAIYAAAGIRIRYTYQGEMYSVVAWSGIMACVATPSRQIQASTRCHDVSDKFIPAVRKVAGLS